MLGKRLYFFSHEDLQIREARFPRLKVAMLAVVVTVTATIVASLAGVELAPMLGVGETRAERENRMLRARVETLLAKVSAFEKELTVLGDKTNTMRLLVDLPALDEETRQASVGGAPETNMLELSEGFDGVLNGLGNVVQRLERELGVQKTSYSEVVTKFDENKLKFRHLPALRPIEGVYSPESYGWRIHPVLGIRKFHEGIDIIADVGTPVYAPADGTIRLSGIYDGGYGVTVLIDHGFGYSTLFAHLSKVVARKGQQVKRGDLIAYSGRSGLVSGPHLHYEVRFNGIRRNPIDFFLSEFSPVEYRNTASGTN